MLISDWSSDVCSSDLIFLEELLGSLAALADPRAVVGDPRAGFLDHIGLDAEVDQLAGLGDALAVHDVEIDHLDRGRHLVIRSEERSVGKRCVSQGESRWTPYH